MQADDGLALGTITKTENVKVSIN